MFPTGGNGLGLRVQPHQVQRNRLVRVRQAAHLTIYLEPSLLSLEKKDQGLLH
jgi:hypothetical protein